MMIGPANEAHAWVSFVAQHQGIPVNEVLNWSRSDLETAAAETIARLARDHAQALIAQNKPAPKSPDTYSVAVRRMVTGAMAEKRKRAEARQNALIDQLYAEQEAAKL